MDVSQVQPQDIRKPGVSEIWRHRRTGGMYVICLLATLEEDMSPVVVYRDCEASKPQMWVRRVDVFLEKFEYVKMY